jgi:predicted nucleic acid-binding protein
LTTTVVDASIVIRLLANRKADELLRERLSPPRVVHAPHLLDAEVASGIRGLLLGRKVEPIRAATMLTDYRGLRITRHPMQPYLRRVMELHNNFTAYDAFSVALAEALDAPLLTRDLKFKRTVGHSADVHVYP